ncbi:hypothetical protein MSPP1_000948 [Malassezia sp. CBS 17886]|nr:hypothetical protein MSPP1_000948 [Malassezia sp. CBS 17886]
MLVLSAIARSLEAIIDSDPEHSGAGAHTALLAFYQTADLYAYATAAQGPRLNLSRRVGLMAPITSAPPLGEEHARLVAAIAVAAWRDEAMRSSPASARTNPGSRAGSPELHRHAPARRAGVAACHNRSLSVETPRMKHAAGHPRAPGPDKGLPSSIVSMRTGVHNPLFDTLSRENEQMAAPLLLQCNLGRLLVLPIRLPGVAEPQVRRGVRASRNKTPLRDRSRRTSLTGSLRSGSGDVSGASARPARRRMHGLVDGDGTEAYSTEDDMVSGADTDWESGRSPLGAARDARRGQDTVVLFVLNASGPLAPYVHSPTGTNLAAAQQMTTDEGAWRILLDQATAFIDADTVPVSLCTPLDTPVGPAS